METKIVQLSMEQEDMLEKNLIWLIGDAETTTIANFFAQNFFLINHPHFDRFLNSFTWRGENVVRFFDTNQKKGFKERYDYFFYNGFEKCWIPYLRKLLLNRIYAQVKDLAKLILLNEAEITLSLDIILKIVPNSKIIVVVDEGESTIISQVSDFLKNKKNMWQGIKRVSYEDKKTVIEYFAKLWANQKKLLIEFLRQFTNHSFLIISWMEFVNHPDDTLLKISKFLDVKLDSEDIARKIIESNKKNSELNLPRNFTDEDKQLIRKIISDVEHQLKSLV